MTAYDLEKSFTFDNKSSPKSFGLELHRHTSRQKMDLSAACASYATPTADKSIHLATHTTMAYRPTTLS